ncbi:hypothetical protein [Vibrio sp. CyArs1]|nr:hypothetical protein [Vibrio sp. CyArs1]
MIQVVGTCWLGVILQLPFIVIIMASINQTCCSDAPYRILTAFSY